MVDPRSANPTEWNDRTVRFNHKGKRLNGIIVSRSYAGPKGPTSIPDYLLTIRGRSGKTLTVSLHDTYAKIS